MLIKCSECSREVSDKASVCPSCGFSIKDSIKANNYQGVAAVKTKKKNIKLILIPVISILSIILIVFVVNSVIQGINSNRLVGTWVELNRSGEERNISYTFNSDGTFFFFYSHIGICRGTWNISGETLELNLDMRLFTGETRCKVIVEGARNIAREMYGGGFSSNISTSEYIISFSEDNSEIVLNRSGINTTFRKR
jgi:ribosomal protein L37E